MYQALYRKYRPRSFSDVTGQEHVTETLRRQLILGRLSHAYLFVGTRGTGKTTCAKILSRAVNCLDLKDGDPCNKCTSCIGIENGGILDVLELDAASNNGVDNVRALREEAIYSPASVMRRVYIIDEAHMLSGSAFNALLKILEEPPQHLIFILATTELHKVPATILSRCQRFSFKRLSPVSIAARLNTVAEKEGLTLTSDASERLADLADGSMRDALSLLDQCASDTTIDLQRVLDTIGLTGRHELLSMADAIAKGDITSALGVLDKLYGNGKDIVSLLSEIASLIRDTLLHKLSPKSPLLSSGYQSSELSGLSDNTDPQRLLGCLETIRETMLVLSRGGSVKLSAEMCVIRLCAEGHSQLGAETRGNAECGTEQIRNAEFRIPNDDNSVPPSPLAIAPDSVVDGVVEVSHAGDFWQDILEHLKDDIPIHALLGDKSQVQAELQDNTLIVRAGSPFTVSTIESDMFSVPLKKAAYKALGRDVVIRVEINTAVEEARLEKLERLKAFDITTFE